MDFGTILEKAASMGASTVHFTAALHPIFRGGATTALDARETTPVSEDDLSAILNRILTPQQRALLEARKDFDCTFISPGTGRYRVHVSRQKDNWDIVFRLLPAKIKSVTDLNLPPVVQSMCRDFGWGLVVIAGTPGQGKSTSLAGMVEYMNQTLSGRMITYCEDPQEFFHESKSCYIKQKTVELDVKDYAQAVRSALREDVDVLVLGECRSAEVIQEALRASSCMLVLTTVHSVDVVQAINRLIYSVPNSEQEEARLALASNLRAIVCQQLVDTADPEKYGKRHPACEILLNTLWVAEAIRSKQLDQLETYMRHHGTSMGMRCMRDAVYQLYERGVITAEEAVKRAPSSGDMRKLLSGIIQGSETVLEADACEELV